MLLFSLALHIAFRLDALPVTLAGGLAANSHAVARMVDGESDPVVGAPEAESARWACRIRSLDVPHVIARTGVPFRQDCTEAALMEYNVSVELVARSDAAKTTTVTEQLEAGYRDFLIGSPQDDPMLSRSDRDCLIRAQARVKRGDPAFSPIDPFCAATMGRRYQESRQLLAHGEAEARAVLLTKLSECAKPAIAGDDLERLRRRLSLESSNRGVLDRVFYGEIDAGLLVSFDIYGEMEQCMRHGKSLAALSNAIFSIRELDPATSSALTLAAQQTIRTFDSSAATALGQWIQAITSRRSDSPLTGAAAERELKCCDQFIGHLVRQRLNLVGELASVLRQYGLADAADAWENHARRSMFPSAFVDGQSDGWMMSAEASGVPSHETRHALAQRFASFVSQRATVRANLIAALTSDVGVNGRRSAGSESRVKDCRSELSRLDAACHLDLVAMTAKAR